MEENILENGNIAFHGINYDYFKMMSILQYGILSENAARSYGLSINRNYGGFNENTHVSLSESPSKHGTTAFYAFGFVKHGISFVIDVSHLTCIPDNKSGIEGEVYVRYAIPKDKILGIMLPESSINTTIDQLNILSDGMARGYIDNYALNFVDMINSFFETEFDKNEILELIESKNNFTGNYFDKSKHTDLKIKQINTAITKMFDLGFRKKYNYSESPTLIEAITVLTGGNVPIYSTNGKLVDKDKHKSL